MRLQARTCLILTLTLLLAAVSTGYAQSGTITGRVSLTTPEGEVVYGDWVRVFLTTAPVEVPVVDLTSVEVPLERQSRINTGHLEFFRNFSQKQRETGYVLDNKLTRPDGTFAFHRVPVGQYHIVITFPTMIAGVKCAWQEAVEVTSEQDIHLELNHENMALPAY
jgi:hypothetical protein